MLPESPYEVVDGVPFTTYDGVNGAKLHLVNTMQEWKTFYALLLKQKMFAFDTETNSLIWYKPGTHIVGMSFGWGVDNFYIPVRHEDSLLHGKQPDQLRMEDLIDDLKFLFAKEDIWIIGTNAKFDIHYFEKEGVVFKCKVHDTRILWQLYDENAPGALKTIASGWTNHMGQKIKGIIHPDANKDEKELDEFRTKEAKARQKNFTEAASAMVADLQFEPKFQGLTRMQIRKYAKENLLDHHPYKGATKDSVHYGFVPIAAMTKYAALDTFLTWSIFHFCMKNIKWNTKLVDLYRNELELAVVLKDAEAFGMYVDAPFLRNLGTEMEKSAGAKESLLLQEFGDINLKSTDQLVEALLAKGVVLTKKTKSDKLALDSKILSKLQKKYPIVAELLSHKKSLKIKDTYVSGILDKLTEGDILHCNFNQNVTTGRMSATDPNLMNIPRSNDAIRRAFVCPPGYMYVLADYSQIEVRLTAHHSKDPLLLDAYFTGQDVHTRTMCEMFGYDYKYAQEIIEADDKTHPMFKTFSEFRGVAKCVHPSTVLRRPDGSLFTIGSLIFSEPGTFSGKKFGEVVGKGGATTEIVDTYNSGTQDLVHVVSNRGVVTCTKEHRFLLEDGSLCRAGDLQPGTLLAPVLNPPQAPESPSAPTVYWKPFKDCPAGSYTTSPAMAYFGGMFMGDGAVSGDHSVSVTHGIVSRQDIMGVSYADWQKIIFEACESVGLTPVLKKKIAYLGSRSVLRFLEALGLVDQSRELDKNSQKSFRIPEWVWSGGREYLLQFLGGLIDTDGCISHGRTAITTKSAVLAGHVCTALNALGVRYSLERSYNRPYDKYYYRVGVVRADSVVFAPYLRHPGKKKRLEDSIAAAKFKKGVYKPHTVLAVDVAGTLPCVDISVSAREHLYLANTLVTHNTINFGVIYGVAAIGLSEQIKRPEKYADSTDEEWIAACQEFIDGYLSKYIGVKRFVNKVKREAKENEVVYNSFGRPRHLPHINVYKKTKDYSKRWMESSAERQSVNFVVQGDAADVFKIAAVRIHKILRGTKSRLVNFVHDEVQMYIHEDDAHLLPAIKKAMETFDFVVPLVAEFSYCTTNWAEKKKMKF